MIIDEVLDCLIQGVLDDGGEVFAFNGTTKFNVVSAGDGKITIDSPDQEFNVGDKMSIIYVPKYSSAYCDMPLDTDGDGVIDLVDLDADGDGVIDERKPFDPSHVVTDILTSPLDPSNVVIEISPLQPSLMRAREWGKPLIVDRYFPLYMTESEALAASPLAVPDAHSHTLSSHDELGDNWTYWMPLGVNQWHGDYFTCPPDAPLLISVNAVNTYDFEYVDRVSGEGVFASIIPYNYVSQRLGIDLDDNGTFEGQVDYSLNRTLNIDDVLDNDGNIVTAGDFRFAHYDTVPKQAWRFEITEKSSSEDTLPVGHSFREGNYALKISTYTKYDIGTNDAEKHTLSKLAFYSELSNGSNASFSATTACCVVYNKTRPDGTDYWEKVLPLEVSSDGYLVFDDDLFNVGDKIYIVEDYVPNEPALIDVTVINPTDAVTNVEARLADIEPLQASRVEAQIAPTPMIPSLVEAGIFQLDQELTWTQFS